MALFNPDIGMIVRDGDGDALIQHTKKQNSHVEYESVIRRSRQPDRQAPEDHANLG